MPAAGQQHLPEDNQFGNADRAQIVPLKTAAQHGLWTDIDLTEEPDQLAPRHHPNVQLVGASYKRGAGNRGKKRHALVSDQGATQQPAGG